MSENFWGDLTDLKTIRTPKAILVDQAELLNRATSGIVRAQITTGQNSETLINSLSLVAPALGNYTYLVCTVSYNIDIYPCRIFDAATKQSQQCENEEDFKAKLKGILGSAKTKSVIEALLSQSK